MHMNARHFSILNVSGIPVFPKSCFDPGMVGNPHIQ